MRTAIVIFISLLSLVSNAQQSQGYADTLLGLEYEVFEAGEDDRLRNERLLDKFNYQLVSKDYGPKLVETARRINSTQLDSGVVGDFLWNRTLAYLVNGNVRKALRSINKYQAVTKDTSEHSMVVEYLAAYQLDYSRAEEIIDFQLINRDSSYQRLHCLTEVDSFSMKGINAYIIPSLLLPGSGLIALGKPLKGLTATVINAACVGLIYYLVREQLYINAAGLGGMFFMKFYPGQIKLTGVEFEKKESRKKRKLANECQTSVSELLDEIDFR